MHYFLVYDDNTYSEHVQRLIQSVEKYGSEFQIVVFRKDQIDVAFYEKNKSILDLPRGGGYWLWKPYIIHELMNTIQDQDIILYLDSKYYFIEDFTDLYQTYLEKNDLLVFKNKPNESTNPMKHLCKMDVVFKYDMYDKLYKENVDEYWAGCMFIKKTTNTMQIMQKWLDMCCIYEDITDCPSKMPNHTCFWDHRHDQSLLSILLHKKNIPQCFFENKYLQNVRNPFSH